MKSKHFLIYFLRVNLAMILLEIVSHIFFVRCGYEHHYLYSSLPLFIFAMRKIKPSYRLHQVTRLTAGTVKIIWKEHTFTIHFPF